MSNLYNIYVVKTGATSGIFAIRVHVDWTQMAIFAILLQNTANICLSILKVDILLSRIIFFLFLLFIGYVRIQLQDCLQKNINTQSD